jgi:NADH-ubiquinone oxidoreductase chain 3
MYLVVIIASLFLVINFFLAPHNPYQEKYSIFECGYHSFLGQNRIQFGIKFFVFALVFLLLDLEILLIYPFTVSGYYNGEYGLIITVTFLIIITLGFIFELGKGALKIDSKQSSPQADKSSTSTEYIKRHGSMSLGQIRYFHVTNYMSMDWDTLMRSRGMIRVAKDEIKTINEALRGDKVA